MNNEQQTYPRRLSVTQFTEDRTIVVIHLLKRHYRAIRLLLSDPYTDANEVYRVLGELNLLPPQAGLPEIVRALASKDLKLRDRSVNGARNIFFPLLLGDETEKRLGIMDLIQAEMIAEDRF